MSKRILIFILLSISLSASASSATLEFMTTCLGADGEFFTVKRDTTDSHLGLLEFNSLHDSIQVAAEIDYTNAGARAIVRPDGFPMLIVTSGGPSDTTWKSKIWSCEGDF